MRCELDGDERVISGVVLEGMSSLLVVGCKQFLSLALSTASSGMVTMGKVSLDSVDQRR